LHINSSGEHVASETDTLPFDITKNYRVRKGNKFRLADFDPGDTDGETIGAEEAEALLAAGVKRLARCRNGSLPSIAGNSYYPAKVGRRDDYMRAYEDMIRHTATPEAPWYVIPADHKWFTRLVVAATIVGQLEKLNPQFPKLDEEALRDLEKSRKALLVQASILQKRKP
jgi:hypothetical protein